jgi:hypothetical protein
MTKKYCSPCKISVDKLKRHEQTKKHYDKCKELGIVIELPERKYKCELEGCNYSTHRKDALAEHKKGVMHNMTIEEKKTYITKLAKERNITGPKNENIIKNLMVNKIKKLIEVKCIGYTGNKYDISYKIKDDIKNNKQLTRYLQVKTITKIKNKNVYKLKTYNDYDPNTLIVGINSKYNIYCLIFFKESNNVSGISFIPDSEKAVYNKYFYTDIDLFIKDFSIKIESSYSMEHEYEGLTDCQQMEYFSLNRFEKKCKQFDLVYERNKIINEIDCFVNGFKIQHKSSATKHVNIDKNHKAYTDKDNIDYFILNDTSENYINDFYIIPMEILIKEGYITTDEKIGQPTITLKHEKQSWMKKYKNNFTQFDGIFVLYYNRKLEIYT